MIKLESANPTGSMKDRAALAIVRCAAEGARLQPGDTIVECTSGSTGTSLASVAVALGYKCLLVSSDAFSAEKLSHMRALGADLELLRSDNKKITVELVTALIETSRQLSQQPGHFWADQFHNTDVLTGYAALGNEIWTQTDGRIDAYVQGVGTGGSLRGTAEALSDPRIAAVLVGPGLGRDAAARAMLAETLARAFQNESGWSYVIPDAKLRAQRLVGAARRAA